MPIVKAQCTNCGGLLEVDNAKDAAICPFCGTPYIVEKAINNYTINNKFEIKSAEINIHGDDIEKMLTDADALYRLLNEKEKAVAKYQEIAYKFPTDYRGWWGLLVIETSGFRAIDCTIKAKEYYEKANAVAPNDVKEQLAKEFEPYYKLVSKRELLLSKSHDIPSPTSTANSGLICVVLTLPFLLFYFILFVINHGISSIILLILATVFFLVMIFRYLTITNTNSKVQSIYSKQLLLIEEMIVNKDYSHIDELDK